MPTTSEVATLPNHLTLHMNVSCAGTKKCPVPAFQNRAQSLRRYAICKVRGFEAVRD